MDVHQLLDARPLMDVHFRCLTLFVTHYPRIAELQSKYPGEIGPYFVSYLAEDPSAKISNLKPSALDPPVEEATQRITFLYKLVPGVASRSFGLHVARLAQVLVPPILHHIKKSTLISCSFNDIYPQHWLNA